MERTIAQMYMDQGEQRGKQKWMLVTSRTILLRQLRKRFKRIPRKMESRIAATTNQQELDTWLDNVIDAATMADVGIPQ